MITITGISSDGVQGTADFWMEEMGTETRGNLQFRITQQHGKKTLSVLDPFGSQNTHAYEMLVGLLEFELKQRGLLPSNL